jgi:PAS domain S-box-containing protein
MPPFRCVLPPAVLVVLSSALGAVLVHVTTIVLAPGTTPGIRIALVAAAALASAIVTGIALQPLVADPLRRVLHVLYRMTEGDFTPRTRPQGTGLIAELMRATDDLAGRLEARCEAARASEARFRRLYDNSPAGLFQTRPDGRVLECNLAAARLLGFDSVTEAKTHDARAFYADVEERERVIESLRRDALVANRLVEFRCKDGRVLPVLLTAHAMTTPAGPVFDGQFIDASGFHATAGRRCEAGADR